MEVRRGEIQLAEAMAGCMNNPPHWSATSSTPASRMSRPATVSIGSSSTVPPQLG